MRDAHGRDRWRVAALVGILSLAAFALVSLAYFRPGAAPKTASPARILHPQANVRIVDPAFCAQQITKLEASGLIVDRPATTEFVVDERQWKTLSGSTQRMIGSIARCWAVDGYLYRDQAYDFAKIKSKQSGRVLAIAYIGGVYLP